MTNEEQAFWDEITKEAVGRQQIKLDNQLKAKRQKLLNQIFECRDPENTAKGRRLLREYNNINAALLRSKK